MIINEIKFEEEYYSKTYKTWTYYYTAPKKLLEEYGFEYPEADSTEISIEYQDDKAEATVMISPTKDGSDYDWNNLDISREDIEYLLSLAPKTSVEEG